LRSLLPGSFVVFLVRHDAADEQDAAGRLIVPR